MLFDNAKAYAPQEEKFVGRPKSNNLRDLLTYSSLTMDEKKSSFNSLPAEQNFETLLAKYSPR